MMLTQIKLKSICNCHFKLLEDLVSSSLRISNQIFQDLKFERFYNEFGKITLAKVKRELKKKPISNDELIKLFKIWQNQEEYMILRKIEFECDESFLAVKCAKRGNDVYQWRLENRFKELDSLIQEFSNENIFDEKNLGDEKYASFDFENSIYPKIIEEYFPETTNVLFVTFTIDPKKQTQDQAWKNIGIDFNRAISFLKRKYHSNISIFRTWESQKNGYPHIHAILIFKDKKFHVFEHINKTQTETTFRIVEKRGFEKCWNNGFIDVVAINSIQGVLKYTSKYVRKTFGTSANLTQAKLWIHSKRSFSMSGNFVELIRLVKTQLHNSNKNEPNQFSTFEFVGISSKNNLKQFVKYIDSFQNGSWTLELKSIEGLEFPNGRIEKQFKKSIPKKIYLQKLKAYSALFEKEICVKVIEFDNFSDYGDEIELLPDNSLKVEYSKEQKIIEEMQEEMQLQEYFSRKKN